MGFWNKCRRNLDEDTQIVTFGVINFYTSIPHKFDLETIDYFLAKYQEDLHLTFRKEFFLELANFILENKTLAFDSRFYLQIEVTALGIIFVPSYANLTVGYNEIKVYSFIRQSHALASKQFENSCFGYLDDCQVLRKVNLIKTDHLLSISN